MGRSRASGDNLHREVVHVPAGRGAGTGEEDGDTAGSGLHSVEVEGTHIVAVAAGRAAARSGSAGIAQHLKGGGIRDIRDHTDHRARAGTVVRGPEGHTQLVDVIGELGEHQHVRITLELDGIAAGVGRLAVVSVNQGEGAAASRVGDRSLPADGRGVEVALEVLGPRVVLGDGQGTTCRGEVGLGPEAVLTAAAVRAHAHLVGGVGLEAGDDLGHGGHRAHADPVGVGNGSVFHLPGRLRVTWHPVHGHTVAGNAGDSDVRGDTGRGGVARGAEDDIVTVGGAGTAGRRGGGAVGATILIDIAGSRERCRVRAPRVARRPGTGHIQHNQQQVVRTVVHERRGELEGVETGLQLLRGVEDQLCVGGVNPAGATGLGSVHQINLQVTVNRIVGHIEGHGLDAPRGTNLGSEEQLLGVRVVVGTIGGQVAERGGAVANGHVTADQAVGAEVYRGPVAGGLVVTVLSHAHIVEGGEVKVAQEITGGVEIVDCRPVVLAALGILEGVGIHRAEDALFPGDNRGSAGQLGNLDIVHGRASRCVVEDHIVNIVAATGAVGDAEGNVPAVTRVVVELHELLRVGEGIQRGNLDGIDRNERGIHVFIGHHTDLQGAQRAKKVTAVASPEVHHQGAQVEALIQLGHDGDDIAVGGVVEIEEVGAAVSIGVAGGIDIVGRIGSGTAPAEDVGVLAGGIESRFKIFRVRQFCNRAAVGAEGGGDRGALHAAAVRPDIKFVLGVRVQTVYRVGGIVGGLHCAFAGHEAGRTVFDVPVGGVAGL